MPRAAPQRRLLLLHVLQSSVFIQHSDLFAVGVQSTVVLTPPDVPNPPIATNFQLQVPGSGAATNLSIPQFPGFMGFSVEMSVMNQICK